MSPQGTALNVNSTSYTRYVPLNTGPSAVPVGSSILTTHPAASSSYGITPKSASSGSHVSPQRSYTAQLVTVSHPHMSHVGSIVAEDTEADRWGPIDKVKEEASRDNNSNHNGKYRQERPTSLLIHHKNRYQDGQTVQEVHSNHHERRLKDMSRESTRVRVPVALQEQLSDPATSGTLSRAGHSSRTDEKHDGQQRSRHPNDQPAQTITETDRPRHKDAPLRGGQLTEPISTTTIRGEHRDTTTHSRMRHSATLTEQHGSVQSSYSQEQTMTRTNLVDSLSGLPSGPPRGRASGNAATSHRAVRRRPKGYFEK
ncbi:hypothetical protein BGX31_002469 [Mortierella sp. GBA43]|nr:hypothetical protein BGX31_002469 [Mortierella sp. GBA43]